MISLFLQYLIAHILGDFVFQPKKWVKDKERRKIKARSLYAHTGVHVLCLLVALGFNPKYIGGFTLVIISHFIIDVTKIYLQKKNTKRLFFFLDQTLHCIIIAIATCIYFPQSITISSLFTQNSLLLIACLLFIGFVSPIIINSLLSYWKIEDILKNKESLTNAGKYIGILERLFIFGFIISNHWEGVGFLIAAKSIFRFGDLTTAKNRKLTEYILIGTLLSFGLAVITGIIYNMYFIK